MNLTTTAASVMATTSSSSSYDGGTFFIIMDKVNVLTHEQFHDNSSFSNGDD